MRFFTFKEIAFPTATFFSRDYDHDPNDRVKTGCTYYITRDKFDSKSGRNANQIMADENLAVVTFDVDPSVSGDANENLKLAKYLKDRYLTIDMYDAESRFLYATTKIPLF